MDKNIVNAKKNISLVLFRKIILMLIKHIFLLTHWLAKLIRPRKMIEKCFDAITYLKWPKAIGWPILCEGASLHFFCLLFYPLAFLKILKEPETKFNNHEFDMIKASIIVSTYDQSFSTINSDTYKNIFLPIVRPNFSVIRISPYNNRFKLEANTVE